jgi:hypothetical protein
MRNKWVDLMIRRGGLACAEMTYSQNHSPSNFRAMYRARVMYEAAVEAIGKDVVAKSQKIEDAAIRRAQLQPKPLPVQGPDTTAGPDLRRVRTFCACPSCLRVTPARI